MILGRDSHKASFDGLRLADCDAALLPCINDQEFGVPLGVDLNSISDALENYGSEVMFQWIYIFNSKVFILYLQHWITMILHTNIGLWCITDQAILSGCDVQLSSLEGNCSVMPFEGCTSDRG